MTWIDSKKKMHHRITPDLITSRGQLPLNTVVAFGSNPEGRHGKGAALMMRKYFGAIYGQAEGLQGESYGIITKELRRGYPPITLAQIEAGVKRFIVFVKANPDRVYYITGLGTVLAYYTPADIAPLFLGICDDSNVYLPISFWDVIDEIKHFYAYTRNQ